QDGLWDRVGKTRHLQLADGNRVREEILEYQSPARIFYKIGDISGPFGLLISHANGEFALTDIGATQTRVRWTYHYHSKNLFTAPFVFVIIRLFWQAYMHQVLARVAALAKPL
ncbi:MAG: SRPBCC family protein, partial [Bdellovibrionota bacterium]